jgi:hypothetical protein
MEIKPDYSIGLDFGEQHFSIDAVYDNVHLFRPLGFSIMKIVTNEGFLQMGTDIEDAEKVAEAAGIIPIERTDIRQSEYQFYLNYQEMTLDDDWLE